MSLRCFIVLCLWAWGGMVVTAAEPKQNDVDFDRQVRPLLADACFQCHGPDKSHREAELRLDTRDGLLNVAAGELVKRITSRDPDERMPPSDSARKLTSDQIDLIRRWVEQGSKWQQHWSLIPPQRPALPAVVQSEWVRNPIDAFVLARLEAAGRAPAPPANARILARRIHLDLTGLPPTPDEVERFLGTTIEETAGQLFGRPTYGEKMAVRWLDAARYADTSGYQSDGWRDMWRWRDWVIDSFNRNQPFDEFTIEQLAGDLLPHATMEQKIATAFNRNHRGNSEGGIVPEEFQVEYVVDRVDTTFAVWQGLTFGCARCHDHKYDPFSQLDYYRVFAAFNRVPEYGRAWKEGNSEPVLPAPTTRQTQELERLRSREETLTAAFEMVPVPARRRLQRVAESMPSDWTIEDGLVARQGHVRDAKTAGKFEYLQAFSFGGWVFAKSGDQGTIVSKMEPMDQGKGYSLQQLPNGKVQANFVVRWLDDSVRVETNHPIPTDQWVHLLVTYDGTRRAAGIGIFVDGKPVGHRALHDFLNQTFAVEEPLRFGAGASDFTGQVEDVHVFDRVLEPREVKVLAGSRIEEWLPIREQAYYWRTAGPQAARAAYAARLQARRERMAFERALPTVMVMRDTAHRPTHLLKRGQYDQPGAFVTAGVPAAMPSLPQDSPANRLGMARWLVSRQNPLTARVIVNRLWRDIFGRGLVRTTEDFGVQGERPSHPQLLDWLAVEFMESGWDIQHVLQLVVTSNTYRQSSRATPMDFKLDPGNQLLSRGPRFRLPAEAIRDQALLVSGLLTQQVGGPSVKPYQPAGLWQDIATTTEYEQAIGPDLYRRSLYTYWKRTVPPPMMINFDAADRESCSVAVRRTNTPLQALNLMNDVTFVEAARVLAEKIMVDASGAEARLRLAYQWVLSRDPTSRESQILLSSWKTHRQRYEEDESAARQLAQTGAAPRNARLSVVEHAAWTVICNTLLNLDEAITKE